MVLSGEITFCDLFKLNPARRQRKIDGAKLAGPTHPAQKCHGPQAPRFYNADIASKR